MIRRLLRFWFTFESLVPARAYRIHGISLLVLKYVTDAAIVTMATGIVWTPLAYFGSVPSMMMGFREAPAWLMPTLMLWSFPFIWVGVTLTARRAHDAGWSLWWTLVFFVPVANYLLMLVLCIVPSAPAEAPPPRRLPQPGASRPGVNRSTSLLTSVVAGTATGLAMTAIEVGLFKEYALALFIGTPFTMGAVTAFIYNRRYEARFTETLQVTAMMLLTSAVLTILLGSEGTVCILMASPILVAVALLGARMGTEIARRCSHDLPPAFFAVLAIPVASLLQPSSGTGHVLHEVRSAIDVEAPPDRVWSHVIAFSPITAAPELPFRLGIASPLSAHIEGRGVGAVRYCVFSTGSFVEPITAWEPSRRLAFDVTDSPPPLRELSLYSNVSPPHLDGYLRSQRGEFRLIALPGGRTRLEGSTWYQLQMAPEGYWQVFSDYLIHAIHRRVLTHIKEEAERR